MNHRILIVFLFFSSTISHTSAPSFATQGAASPFFCKKNLEEGFGKGTLVRTPYGYKVVEQLSVGSLVVAPDGQPKKVTAVAMRIVDRYVHLAIDNQWISIGRENKILTPQRQWTMVHELTPHSYASCAAGHAQYLKCTPVQSATILYMISVEGNELCLAPYDIVVHNAEVAVGAGSLLLEFVAYTHPVIALVGSTVALSAVAYHAYETYRKQRKSSASSDGDEIIPAVAFLAERYYYEQRKKELEELRTAFTTLYNGVATLQALSQFGANSFSYQFFKQNITQHAAAALLKITITDELALSEERKIGLRHVREQELTLLEAEICTMHGALAVHFSALMSRVQDACDRYDTELPAINNASAVWNSNLQALTDAIASEAYTKSLLEESIMLDIQQKVAELKVVVLYYQHCKQISSVQQSTNIVELLEYATDAIAEKERFCNQELIRIRKNIGTHEHYFAQRGIPTAGFKNQLKASFDQEQQNRDKNTLHNAQDKQKKIHAGGGGPKKDDDEIEESVKGAKALADKIAEDAQAPGIPTEKDGYRPPKGWDGKKARHPKNGKVGWPDEKGNIWVPTGPGSKAHGGPHWDVQHPNGRTYDNIYPGGKIRSGSK